MAAATYSQYTGDGNQRDFTVTFPYIDPYHVKVYLNGYITTLYSWLNATTIRMNTAPAQGVDILVRRETQQSSRLVTFTNHTLLNAEQQNKNSNQNFFLLQELLENPPLVNGAPFLRGPQGDQGIPGGSGPTGPQGPQGTPGSNDVTLQYLLSTLTGQLTESQLYQSLVSRIDRIDLSNIATNPDTLENGIVQPLLRNAYEQDKGIWSVTIQAGATAAQMSLALNEWLVKLNANGHVAGVGLLLDPFANRSEFIILADSFKVVNPSLSTDIKTVFTVGNVGGVGTIGINGNLLIDGSVVATRLSVTTLSAITADMGTLTAGTIQQSYTAPGDNNTTPGAGLKITGGAIEAYGNSHALGGNLVSSDGNYMVSIGRYLTATGKAKRYPLHNTTNFAEDGRTHIYEWSGSAWVEQCSFGKTSYASVYSSVLAFGPASGRGVSGYGGASGIGVYGEVPSTTGTGYGVYGACYGSNAYGGGFEGDTGPLFLKPSASASAPTHSAFLGTLWVTSAGVLYINTSGSTTWAKVGAQ